MATVNEGRTRVSWSGVVGLAPEARLLHPLPDEGVIAANVDWTELMHRAFVTLGLRPGTENEFRVTVEVVEGGVDDRG